ncbi:hypothetical protein OGAPHI_003581 [Ogataea philodendri]|uniref:C3H1-type domain-containing protein n=1 Tax=Ogataea philodendri TaxID=1378263 RepID=A0A9P8P5M7_9ASCO|nr:uncharacterized protein OGAPHI_003581 [Ogataea philodendri]KAH3665397.1 hypothetical protein OGAPHI_003581 [Ogataea philodendri]
MVQTTIMTNIWGDIDQTVNHSLKLDYDTDLDLSKDLYKLKLSNLEITPSISETSTVISSTASSGNLLFEIGKEKDRSNSTNIPYLSSAVSTPKTPHNAFLISETKGQPSNNLCMADLLPTLWDDQMDEKREFSSIYGSSSKKVPLTPNNDSAFSYNDSDIKQSYFQSPRTHYGAFNSQDGLSNLNYQQSQHAQQFPPLWGCYRALSVPSFEFADKLKDISSVQKTEPLPYKDLQANEFLGVSRSAETQSPLCKLANQQAQLLTEENLSLLDPSNSESTESPKKTIRSSDKSFSSNSAQEHLLKCKTEAHKSTTEHSSDSQNSHWRRKKNTKGSGQLDCGHVSTHPKSAKHPSLSSKAKINADNGLYKTEMCTQFKERGTCPYGSKCQFAHGEDELKVVKRSDNWKTKLCANWSKSGTCRYGKRCCFKHGDEDNGFN